MRSPSPRCLPNRVDLYRFTGTKDAAGGITGDSHPIAFATNVACSVQPAAPERFVDNTDRLVQKTMYNVMFLQDYSLRLDDKIVWVDTAGAIRNLFVYGNADQAGRGSAFVAQCEERK